MSKEIEKMTAIYEKHKNTMYAVALKILKIRRTQRTQYIIQSPRLCEI